MRKCLFLLLFGLMLAPFSAEAQTRTVTNADLEKFRSERLEAERQYRQNYERLGLPSPEELERRRTESAHERDELSARLRAERIQREQFAAMASRAAAEREGSVVIIENGRQQVVGYGVYGYPVYRNRRYWARPGVVWRATPGGVIYEPGGRSSYIYTPRFGRPRPAFRIRAPRPPR
ncbi:MAG: hypothetical protein KF831_08950 [Acidobacteria bacterium]|nr:hypothetical protein [Acidobacteriota bacterium]